MSLRASCNDGSDMITMTLQSEPDNHILYRRVNVFHDINLNTTFAQIASVDAKTSIDIVLIPIRIQ